MIMPIITGATGIVTKGLKKNLEDIPGKHSIDSLRETAVVKFGFKVTEIE